MISRVSPGRWVAEAGEGSPTEETAVQLSRDKPECSATSCAELTGVTTRGPTA